MTVTIGKWRRLQQCAGQTGAFTVLAIDHRGAIRRALAADTSRQITDEDLTEMKDDIVRHLSPLSSAVLLDPETSAGRCVASGAMSGAAGLIVTLDTGSTGDPHNRSVPMVRGWSVAKAARLGASAVKLLIYYHPDGRDAAVRERLVRRVAAACEKFDMPFFLEVLSYWPKEPARPMPSDERRSASVETARRLAPLGPDVLKMEFPVNMADSEKDWRSACDDLTAACPIPWVLLSGGVPFETFARQVEVACGAGASGVMAGRAVWNEANTLDARVRNGFLEGAGRDRMHRLRLLCDERARPFTAVYAPPKLARDWYKKP